MSGLFAGWLVRVAMGSRRDFGIPGDLTLGSLGGLIGGWPFRYLGVTPSTGNISRVFVAVIGAALLVAGLRLVRNMVYATGVTSLPTAVAFEADLDNQVRLLNDFERRVLARVLGRKPSMDGPTGVSTPSSPSVNGSPIGSRPSVAAGPSLGCS